MNQLSMFIPLAKVDAEKRLVYGVATAELPDRVGEVFDYESSKPFFKAWSDGINKTSDGKSVGNLRAMHGKVAAGKLIDIAFDDDAKQISVVAKVVDDAEWKKVLEGVYTGFSQGGRYVKRWADPDSDYTRYTADPSEISLVDLPCLPEATFDVVKADGLVEKRTFSSAERKKDAKSGAAMRDGSFPIENGSDLENAIRLAGKAKDPAAARAHIKRRAAALGLSSKIPDSWKALFTGEDVFADQDDEAVEKAAAICLADVEDVAEVDPIEKATAALDALDAALKPVEDDAEKGMGGVQHFAELLRAISYLHQDSKLERDAEGDKSPMPEKLRDWLKQGVGHFKDMAKEETDELLAAGKAAQDDLNKVAEAEKIVVVEPEMVPAAELAEANEKIAAFQKRVDTSNAALLALAERLGPLTEQVVEMQKRLTVVEDAPLPPKTAGPAATATPVSKEEDVAGHNVAKSAASELSAEEVQKALEAMTPEDRALALIRATHQFPAFIGR